MRLGLVVARNVAVPSRDEDGLKEGTDRAMALWTCGNKDDENGSDMHIFPKGKNENNSFLPFVSHNFQRRPFLPLTFSNTGLPAYSDTVYSGSLLTVTVFGSKFESPYTENRRL